MPLFGAKASFPGYPFNIIKLLEHAHCIFRPGLVVIQCFFKTPAGMCHTIKVGYMFFCSKKIIYAVAIGLKVTRKVLEQLGRAFTRPPFVIVEKHCFLQRAVIHPVVSLMGFPFLVFIEYLLSLIHISEPTRRTPIS